VELRIYDRLFKSPDPGSKENFVEDINKNSLEVRMIDPLMGAPNFPCYFCFLQKIVHGFAESSLSNAKIQDRFQFERVGYFCVDDDSKTGSLVLNKTVSLKESKEKI
jgi:glutaminyl-tRNA synthetase